LSSSSRDHTTFKNGDVGETKRHVLPRTHIRTFSPHLSYSGSVNGFLVDQTRQQKIVGESLLQGLKTTKSMDNLNRKWRFLRREVDWCRDPLCKYVQVGMHIAPTKVRACPLEAPCGHLEEQTADKVKFQSKQKSGMDFSLLRSQFRFDS
jgi:hypothetical protein